MLKTKTKTKTGRQVGHKRHITYSRKKRYAILNGKRNFAGVIKLGASNWSSSDGKASACNAGDWGLIPRLGRSPGEGNGNPLKYSWLENPMGGGTW